MAEEAKFLDVDEAKRTGESFILDRMRGAEVLSSETKFARVKGSPLYQVEGVLSVKERGELGQLLIKPSKYSFRVEIDASRGTVLNWEVH